MKKKESSFIGLEKLKEQQKQELERFEKAIQENKPETIHHSHYDWWMFPINEKSSFGYVYTLNEANLDELKKDSEFIKNWKRGVELLMVAWGWNLEEKKMIEKPTSPHQKWTHYPVRLYKASLSAKLLDQKEVFESLNQFCLTLGTKNISNSDDGIRVQKLFQMPGSENLVHPGPRYK